MHAPGTQNQQTFGLGLLVGPNGSTQPTQTLVEAEGRGVFAKVRLSFEFAPGGNAEERLFLLEKPWDAVVSEVLVNGERLDHHEDGEAGSPSAPHILPTSQLHALEEALSSTTGHVMVVEIPKGTLLSRLSLELVLAVDLQWHRGALRFSSPLGAREVAFQGRWELSGLPGAGIVFQGAASHCRLETLEGSRHRWSEPITVSPDEPAIAAFSLDEKKAASIAVFSPSAPTLGVGPGCAAVAVVAPIRPQLVRDPVRLAILMEIRNPQEGLLLRSMVEKVAGLLKAQDELSLLLVGTDSPAQLVSWSSSEALDDAMLAKLLEPSVIGRAPDLWASMQTLAPQLRTSTHLLIATPGAPGFPAKDLGALTPVFVFATGRKPYRSRLESLAQRSGGFVIDGTAENLDGLAERLRIRLSPPLLSDFKLEGWGLSEVRPAGATQVYTDQPTLVYGLYDGLLPKTVTLSGQSPARQKLAQRVKVENLNEIDLMPLYRDRVRRWDADPSLPEASQIWSGAEATAKCLTHPDVLAVWYESPPLMSLSPAPSSADTMGLDIFGPPKIFSTNDAVTFAEDSFVGAADEPDVDDWGADTGVLEPMTFVGPASFSSGEADLFASEPFGLGSATTSPVIRKAIGFDDPSDTAGGEEEADLFENPSELSAPSLRSPAASSPDDFSPPAGAPTIFRDGDSFDSRQAEVDSASAEAEPPQMMAPPSPVATPPRRGEGSLSDDPSMKRRLLTFRQKQEQEAAIAAPRAELGTRGPEIHAPSEPWHSEWLESLRALEPEVARRWLEGCSIDQLGLAISLLETELAEDVLSRLPPLRGRAVRTQMQLARLLESFEREEADQQLALALTRADL